MGLVWKISQQQASKKKKKKEKQEREVGTKPPISHNTSGDRAAAETPRDAPPQSYPKQSKACFFQRKCRHSLGCRISQIPSHEHFPSGRHPQVYGPRQGTELPVIVLNSRLSPKHRASDSDLKKGVRIGKLLYLFSLKKRITKSSSGETLPALGTQRAKDVPPRCPLLPDAHALPTRNPTRPPPLAAPELQQRGDAPSLSHS